MDAGYRGTFVIAVEQTETDGIPDAPVSAIAVGSVWRWWGQAARIDGPHDVLVLDNAADGALRQRAARQVARLLGDCRLASRGRGPGAWPEAKLAQSFSVTDGRNACLMQYVARTEGTGLLVVSGPLPPAQADLFVTEACLDPDPGNIRPAAGMICFTPGTLIATPEGPRPVEAIRPGDRVETRDDEAQEVLWTGARRLSGARLHARPDLRPVRIRRGALGADRPQGALVVSPDHRILLCGARARALFNSDEVLVPARDLIGLPGISTDTGLCAVTYVHLLTGRHQILRANGLEAESFHPVGADLTLLDPGDRAALGNLLPGLDASPGSYGGFARRCLSMSDAALWRHAAA